MKKKKNSILVLGGTGFIGYHLLLRTVKMGWISFSISKMNPKKNRYIKQVKYLRLDLNNSIDFKKKINIKFDYIVNLSDILNFKIKKILNFLKKIKSKIYSDR